MLTRFCLLAATLCVAIACSTPAPPADGVYTVRGEIVGLPPAAGGDLMIRHEAVRDFRGMDGKPSVMESMTMPFPVAREVKLDGLAVGDPIEFVLELRWNDARGPVRITRVRKLPAGTKLDFGD